MQAAFYKGNRTGINWIYNKGVKFIDRGPYSHCEIIFSNGVSASSSFSDGGVRFKEILYDEKKWDFFSLPDKLEEQAFDWFTAHKGLPYDIKGNVRFILPIINDNKVGYFCSEAFGYSLGWSEAWRFGPNGAAALLKPMYGSEQCNLKTISMKK